MFSKSYYETLSEIVSTEIKELRAHKNSNFMSKIMRDWNEFGIDIPKLEANREAEVNDKSA